MTSLPRLHFVCGRSFKAKSSYKKLTSLYGQAPLEEADIIVALGGDGTMLHSLQKTMHNPKPIFGMNRGSIGFLMNKYSEENLYERLQKAHIEEIHPLRMQAIDENNNKTEALAINEVTLFRQSYQASKLRITVDGKVRLKELICDGVILATPTGSTAYNLSAQGPILPIQSSLIALTAVSPFRPRRWRGALLLNTAIVEVEVLEAKKRPVNVTADDAEQKNIQAVTISCALDIKAKILFEETHSWHERILCEQFKHS